MTHLSTDCQANLAALDAAHGESVRRGKDAAAQRQAEARAAHASEVAARQEADAAMGIPPNWTETRKAAARSEYAKRQRAAQVEAERAANPGRKVSPGQHRGWRPLSDVRGELVQGPRGPVCGTFKGRK